MSKNKAPAFQFYAENFLTGTADMTPAEVGTYIRLLCHQWHKNGLPDDDKKLMQLTGAKKSELQVVKAKFEKATDGMLRNVRMEVAREEQRIYREKQKANAEARWKQKQDAKNMPPHQSGIESGISLPDALQSLPSSLPEIPNTEIQNNTLKGEKHFNHIKEFYSHPYEKQFAGFKSEHTKHEYESFQRFLDAMFRDFTVKELSSNFDKCLGIGDWKKHFKSCGFLKIKPAFTKSLGAAPGNRDNMAMRIVTYANGIFDDKIFSK